jgi:Kae1-associated kinase Bud32
MRKVAHGAEATIYASSLFGKPVLVKTREPKAYRVKELDLSLRSSRTKIEARALLNAARAGVAVPNLFYVDDFSIYQQQLAGKLLRDTTTGPAVYRKIGKMLAVLHSTGITHGDFTPANVIVKGRDAWIIDFGLAVFSKDREEQAVDVLLMQKSIGKQFKPFLEGYKANPNWKGVVARAEQIKQRGRYQMRGA